MRVCALQHSIEVVPKRFMSEIGADIDKLHGEPLKVSIVPSVSGLIHGCRWRLHTLLARERRREVRLASPFRDVLRMGFAFSMMRDVEGGTLFL
jgi:hypothetical protein